MRLLGLLFACLGIVHAGEVDTQPLSAWLERQTSIKSIQTDFTQERTLPALKKPVTSPGTMTMVRGGGMRWDLGEPLKTTAISDGETLQFIDHEKKQARSIPADSSRARSFTLLGDSALSGGLEGFTKVFELVESRVTDGIYQLTARPKQRAMRDKVSWVYFDIDTRKNELRAMAMQLDDKSRIRTVFQNPRFNVQVPKNHFEIDLSGYKVR